MALKNYTTTIDANKTIGEIQGILASHGATKIMTDYQEGEVVALSFRIVTNKGEIGIKLPANIEKVLQVLRNQRKKSSAIRDTKEQATKTAWRNIKDWLDAQMAILECEMVEIDEIFLPYIVNKQRTNSISSISKKPVNVGRVGGN